jgi:hypothetical protein
LDDYLPELRTIKALPVFNHFGFDAFSVDRERDKNGFSLVLAYTGSPKGNVMYV